MHSHPTTPQRLAAAFLADITLVPALLVLLERGTARDGSTTLPTEWPSTPSFS